MDSSAANIFSSFILTKYDNSKNSAIYFGLPLIERSLETSDCIITASAIEISPKGIDLDKISSLEEASRRIYMSATLADDSVFVSALGLNTEDMKNIITPENANDIGDRLIIFPKYVNSDISEIEIKEKIEKIAEKYNVVILVPSFSRAKFWDERGIRTATKDNIDKIVAALKSGKHVGKIIFVNRYDGIDLPGDACRMLVIDGLPPLNSIKDTQTIKKDYCNQLSGSVNWFKENYVYPNECVPIMIHPSKVVDEVASPDENMRVMTEKELTCFRKNLRDFYSTLCQNENLSDVNKINELLRIYKLRKDDIVNRYTVKFERKD